MRKNQFSTDMASTSRAICEFSGKDNENIMLWSKVFDMVSNIIVWMMKVQCSRLLLNLEELHVHGLLKH